MRKRLLILMMLIFTISFFTSNTSVSAQTCTTIGDINNDSLGLSVADLVFLVNFLKENTSSLPIPYKADMNGDCVIDWLDAIVYDDYFIYGTSVFVNGLPVPTCCTVQEYCCTGIRGNVDYDTSDLVDISDLNYLVDYMFNSGPHPTCPMEANMDGSGGVDISDLNYLVDFMFNSGPAPVSCF